MNRIKALVLVAVASLTLSACEFNVYDLPLPGGPSTGDDPMTITVEFSDVLDLVPQSNVQVNDVPVGKVKSVDLDGYQAIVTLEVKNSVELPDNARAEIRQTGLLGEKFVELKAPEKGGQGKLEDGETIPIERAGRNPEVEEVFGALSLVLNGGGIAQLKTINTELTKALEGREGAARSVLQQLRRITGSLDQRKADIVDAIESLDRLARNANKQEDTINAALEELPSAIKSIDSQREDLVKMLRALDRLSEVGIRVINQSKDATIATLRRLDPVLTQLANSGDSFVDAFQVFLTYPFVDEVVGRDPQVARDVKLGDYTNLAIKLDLDLETLLTPETVCTGIALVSDELKNGGLSLQDIIGADPGTYCRGAVQAAQKCLNGVVGKGKLGACRKLLGQLNKLTGPVLKKVCKQAGLGSALPKVCGTGNGSGGNNGPSLPVDPTKPLNNLPGGGGGGSGGGGGGGNGPLGGNNPLNRAPFYADLGADAAASAPERPSLGDLDPDLVRLLVPGVLAR